MAPNHSRRRTVIIYGLIKFYVTGLPTPTDTGTEWSRTRLIPPAVPAVDSPALQLVDHARGAIGHRFPDIIDLYTSECHSIGE